MGEKPSRDRGGCLLALFLLSLMSWPAWGLWSLFGAGPGATVLWLDLAITSGLGAAAGVEWLVRVAMTKRKDKQP
jgi:hypothetical protein